MTDGRELQTTDEQVDASARDVRTHEELVAKAWVEQCERDAIECFERRRGLVAYPLYRLPREDAHREVRRIATWGARLALGLQRNGARLDRFDGDPPPIWEAAVEMLIEAGANP